MINYTEPFFDLKLIPINKIKLHETTETKRLRNIFDRIAGSRFLNNPVIVAKVKDDLILIDGANRLSTLNDIGCKLTIAQVIDYNNNRIKLKNWNHLIYDFDISLIRKFCEENNLKVKEYNYYYAERLRNKSKTSAKKYIVASLINSNDSALLISLPTGFKKVINILNRFTKLYFGKYKFDRTEEEIKYSELIKYSRKSGVLVEFPKFTKSEVIKASNSKYKIPAGITRHILINRVLHVRYDIEKLKDETDIDKKSKDLYKYLINKIDNDKVRQYRESVIVFDE
ncbi:MAG: hypothetical protein N2490_04900 [Ignavibacteria bacterium]|nr:hypothetical protein [Ignavibacteria bacterium]